jgi:hypothetical protein
MGIEPIEVPNSCTNPCTNVQTPSKPLCDRHQTQRTKTPEIDRDDLSMIGHRFTEFGAAPGAAASELQSDTVTMVQSRGFGRLRPNEWTVLECVSNRQDSSQSGQNITSGKDGEGPQR